MSKATLKKKTKVGTRMVIFVMWCYGLKFVPMALFTLFSYSTLMGHPLDLIDSSQEEDHEDNLALARIVCVFAVVLHLGESLESISWMNNKNNNRSVFSVTVSSSFVHRDFLFWKRNAFQNKYWAYSSGILLTIHGLLMVCEIYGADDDDDVEEKLLRKWPVMVFILCSVLVTFFITELCKWQEIK